MQNLYQCDYLHSHFYANLSRKKYDLCAKTSHLMKPLMSNEIHMKFSMKSDEVINQSKILYFV